VAEHLAVDEPDEVLLHLLGERRLLLVLCVGGGMLVSLFCECAYVYVCDVIGETSVRQLVLRIGGGGKSVSLFVLVFVVVVRGGGGGTSVGQ
jgi:hypothetical protein